MQLSREQQDGLKAQQGICANEVCDKCQKPLDHIRYTRRDEAGEWCSRLCRDGVDAAERYTATRKQAKGRCWQCSLPMPADQRTDSKFCDSACKKANQRLKAA